MQKLLLITLMLALTGFIFAEKKAVFPDLTKPGRIAVDKNQLLITQGKEIYIYSRKNYSLVKKFGKKGEGPGEFKQNSFDPGGLQIHVQPDYILVTSVGKVSFFTREGKFKKEIKVHFNLFRNIFKPLGKRFVGIGSAEENQSNIMAINIYNPEFKKIGEICRFEKPFIPGKGTKVFLAPYTFHTYNQRVFVTTGSDFLIDIFDSQGKKVSQINYDYKKLKVTEDHKKIVMNHFKTNPLTKRYFMFMKPIIFPDFYPAIRNFHVLDKKVYVRTYKKKGNKSEFLIFDINGKFIKTIYIPFADKDIFQPFPYTIYNEKFFQLIENEDEEEWELHIFDIK